MDWLITLSIIGLNAWAWYKGKWGVKKRLLVGAGSVAFLYWFNYLRKR